METDLPRPRVFKRRGAVIALILLAISLLPLLLTFGAGVVASQNGCVLHEGFPNDCIVNGQDIGGPLYQFGLLAWYSVFMLPLWFLATWFWFAASLGRSGLIAWPWAIAMVVAPLALPLASNVLLTLVFSYRKVINLDLFDYLLKILALAFPLILVVALVTSLFKNGFEVRESGLRDTQK